MPADFGPATIERYEDAVLTPARFVHTVESVTNRARSLLRRLPGRTPPPGATHQTRVVGAVYSAGRLVPASQRDPFPDVAPADPLSLGRIPKGPEGISGTWLYGGHWMGQFGHFLLETLSALWPDPARERVTGLLFHLWPSDEYAIPPLEWQRWLIDQAGWRVPIRIVAGSTVKVDDLLVPTRAYRLHRGALPQARAVWDRIAPEQPADTAVFLSRSRLRGDTRQAPNDAFLDEALAAAGCQVVHPQELTIQEQVAAVSRARTLIGVSGSQLHLSMFARSCSNVIELGDRRLPTLPIFEQISIAEARGQQHHFVPLLTDPSGRDIRTTIDRVLALGI